MVVAAAVQAAAQWFTRRADRAHESALRNADRTHEAELRRLDHEHELLRDRLADERTVRNRRADRIYRNLQTLLEGIVTLGEMVDRLRMFPLEYREDRPEVDKALGTITVQRAALLIDAETAQLFERLGEALRAHRVWWLALENWDTARQARDPALPDLSKESRRLGDELAKLVLDVIRETRESLARAEAPLQ